VKRKKGGMAGTEPDESSKPTEDVWGNELDEPNDPLDDEEDDWTADDEEQDDIDQNSGNALDGLRSQLTRENLMQSVEKLRSRKDGEDTDEDEKITEPSQAELVDGAQVLFIDPAAGSKNYADYDLVLITSSQYPEPIVLKNDTPVEVPEGTVLCSSTEATMIKYSGKRVIARSYILVPPSRADEVSPDYREEVPEALVGKTIPRREVQNEQFYNLVLNALTAS